MYDGDGLLVQAGEITLNRAAQQAGIIQGKILGAIQQQFSNNQFAEMIQHSVKQGVNDLISINYDRDNIGRITERTITQNNEAVTEKYTYGSVGRLIEVERNGLIIEYNYDANGNRLSKVIGQNTELGSYDDQDRLKSYGNCSYQYTANGVLSTKTCANQVTQYEYDLFENLLEVTLQQTGQPTQQLEYTVDAANRRVQRKLNGNVTHRWLYESGLSPVAELNSQNQVISRFVYGSRGHIPEYMVKNNQTYLFITDQLGSPLFLVNASNGEIAQKITYDEFGSVLSDSNPGFQPFGFAGGLYDPTTQLVRFGARDYDSYTGRWTSKDPILFDGGDSNLYNYVFADPVNFIDPNGEFANLAGGFVFGGGLDLLIQLYIEGRSLECVNWGRVVMSGAAGAAGVGIFDKLSKIKFSSSATTSLSSKTNESNR